MTQELRSLYEITGDIKDINTVLVQRDRVEKAEKDAAVAIGMLADWCVAVDQNGTGWDDWDEHYKDAMYRPCPIREQLDEAIKVSQEERQ